MQDELASLSPDSRHLVVKGSGHMIEADKPQAVIDAIDLGGKGGSEEAARKRLMPSA